MPVSSATQRRPRARRQHGCAPDRRQPPRRARARAVRRANQGGGGAAPQRELDHARRLGRLRAVGRGLGGTARERHGRRRDRAFPARSLVRGPGHPRPSGLRQPLRPQRLLRQHPGPRRRRDHGCDAGAARGRDRQGRERPAHGSPPRCGGRPRPSGDPAHLVRAAPDPGAGGAPRGSRERRDHDAGPDHGSPARSSTRSCAVAAS